MRLPTPAGLDNQILCLFDQQPAIKAWNSGRSRPRARSTSSTARYQWPRPGIAQPDSWRRSWQLGGFAIGRRQPFGMRQGGACRVCLEFDKGAPCMPAGQPLSWSRVGCINVVSNRLMVVAGAADVGVIGQQFALCRPGWPDAGRDRA